MQAEKEGGGFLFSGNNACPRGEFQASFFEGGRGLNPREAYIILPKLQPAYKASLALLLGYAFVHCVESVDIAQAFASQETLHSLIFKQI